MLANCSVCPFLQNFTIVDIYLPYTKRFAVHNNCQSLGLVIQGLSNASWVDWRLGGSLLGTSTVESYLPVIFRGNNEY